MEKTVNFLYPYFSWSFQDDHEIAEKSIACIFWRSREREKKLNIKATFFTASDSSYFPLLNKKFG